MADPDESVTVTAPYTVRTERERTRGSAISEERVSVSRAVSIRDLDLRYDGDVEIAVQRVDIAAREACDYADELQRFSETSDSECRREAVRGARPQLRAAIARANAS
jgi:UrcA family protein